MTYRGAVLDVDGTVVRGDEPIPGAKAGLEALAAAGVGRLFVSNNPTKPPEAYEQRLERAGFRVDPEEVLTSGSITTRYLREEHRADRIAVVGEAGLVEQFEDAGLRVVPEFDRADVLVVSLDRGFDYDRLCAAYWALEDGSVTFLGTDPDMVIPAVERDVPGSGAVINAVAGVAGREPERVLGKPSVVARRAVLETLGVAPEECLVVGDRLDTDIALGERAGMTTVLVMTGVTDEATLAASEIDPDYVLDSLGDVETVLEDR
jgi:4-nitrophenyl phosphatase